MSDDPIRYDRRNADRWHVNKEINLPTVIAVAMALITAITVVNSVTYRVATIEQEQARARIDATATRSELMQQQSQQRIEATQQFNKLETKFENGIRDLRADIKTIANVGNR